VFLWLTWSIILYIILKKEVATEDELVEITQLRDLLNALVNDMPEITKDCPIGTCGRKFKLQADLDKHMERRHG